MPETIRDAIVRLQIEQATDKLTAPDSAEAQSAVAAVQDKVDQLDNSLVDFGDDSVMVLDDFAGKTMSVREQLDEVSDAQKRLAIATQNSNALRQQKALENTERLLGDVKDNVISGSKELAEAFGFEDAALALDRVEKLNMGLKSYSRVVELSTISKVADTGATTANTTAQVANTTATKGGTVAIVAQTIATKAATVATTLWTAALNAPVLAFGAITAAVGGATILYLRWRESVEKSSAEESLAKRLEKVAAEQERVHENFQRIMGVAEGINTTILATTDLQNSQEGVTVAQRLANVERARLAIAQNIAQSLNNGVVALQAQTVLNQSIAIVEGQRFTSVQRNVDILTAAQKIREDAIRADRQRLGILNQQSSTIQQQLRDQRAALKVEQERLGTIDEMVGRMNAQEFGEFRSLLQRAQAGEELTPGALARLEQLGGRSVQPFVSERFREAGRERDLGGTREFLQGIAAPRTPEGERRTPQQIQDRIGLLEAELKQVRNLEKEANDRILQEFKAIFELRVKLAKEVELLRKENDQTQQANAR